MRKPLSRAKVRRMRGFPGVRSASSGPSRKTTGPKPRQPPQPGGQLFAAGHGPSLVNLSVVIEHAPGDVRCGNVQSGVENDCLPRSVKRGLKQPFTLQSTEASFIVSPGQPFAEDLSLTLGTLLVCGHTSSGMGRPPSGTMAVGRPRGLVQWVPRSMPRWRKVVAARSWGRTRPLLIERPRESLLPMT